MYESAQSLIAELHASDWQGVLALTGGGSRLVADLLEVPGASATVLSAVVPYSTAALADWLGQAPKQACSEATARQMAMAAFTQAEHYGDRATVFGLGLSAALASDRPKKGEHRAHLALQSSRATHVAGLTLAKGQRTRAHEERLVAQWALAELGGFCGLATHLPMDFLPDDQPHAQTVAAPPAWSELLVGQRPVVCVSRDGEPARDHRVLLPGAFNPLHEGHRRLAQAARRRLDRPVDFEISLTNVDKAPLDFAEIQRRLADFPSDASVWLTRAARFTEKAELFPQSVFVVGADTIRRIGDPAYYQGDTARRDAAIDFLADHGCRFLVFGRLEGDTFQTADSLPLPQSLRRLCDVVPGEEFRIDLSSTEIRRQRGEE